MSTTDPQARVMKMADGGSRPAYAEWANAQLRQRGMTQFMVRGIPKVTAVAVLLVVTQNLLRWLALGT